LPFCQGNEKKDDFDWFLQDLRNFKNVTDINLLRYILVLFSGLFLVV
jgi:hypothetical protein